MASQITSLTIVYSTVYSGADQRKHQSSTPLAFVQGIHRGPVNSPHTWPVTRKMFPFDDVIMNMHMVCALFCMLCVAAPDFTISFRSAWLLWVYCRCLNGVGIGQINPPRTRLQYTTKQNTAKREYLSYDVLVMWNGCDS